MTWLFNGDLFKEFDENVKNINVYRLNSILR